MKNKQAIPEVLVVDDDPEVLAVITRGLREYFPDCRVEQASNGVEAVEKLRASSPQLTILDLQLPYMSGRDICKVIRNQPRKYHTRLLVITGQAVPGMASELFDDGIYEFLPKPFSLSDLMSSVNRLLG